MTGAVRDAESQQPLPYATVEIQALQRGAFVGRDGQFEMRELPVGFYTVRASHVGYAPVEIPDVLVRADKSTQLTVELPRQDIRTPAIVVRADPLAGRLGSRSSRHDLSYEEVRRAPGSAADIVRTVQALPGVSHTSDQSSDLVVRGGDPTENLTLLDDVPIPNPNHFPEFGGAGGAISMLNIEIVRDVSFHSGGFPIHHGDKLSSVLEVDLREGSRDGLSGDLEISMAGAGLVLEGPFAGGKGSYIVNGRRSYIGLIATQLGTTTVPTYSDFQGKIAFRPDSRNTWTLLGIAGFDKVILDDDGDAYSRGFDFIDARQSQYAGGVSWKRLAGSRGYTLVTLHRSENNFQFDVRDRLRPGARPDSVYFADSWEAETGIRARTFLRLWPSVDFTFGFEARRAQFRHQITAFADTAQEALPTSSPDTVRLVTLPQNDVRSREAANKMAVFVGLEKRLRPNLELGLSLRYDRFDFEGQDGLSPRAGLSWRPDEDWTGRLTAGVFRQSPLYVDLTQTPSTRGLPFLRADHVVLGVDRRINRSAQATLEAYVKRYVNLPVANARGSRELVPHGRGWVHGLEVFVQQRLLERWYGLASYSYSRSERTDVVFGTYPDDWDYRHVLTLMAGVRPVSGLEVSARWRYIGGRPFTRFRSRFEVTPEGTVEPGSGYFVGFEGPHNGDRHSAYHRFDIRVDRRMQLGRVHLVAFLDVENVYGRNNVLEQRYSHDRAEPETVFQWKLLPIGGLSLEF